jgi:hypothetical protein
MDESAPKSESLSPEEAQAKAAILAECENLAAAGVTFVAVHFDGYGDSGATEDVKCFDSEYYAYEEHTPVPHDAAYLQEHFEALVPFGYENDCGGFGDVVPTLLRAKSRWSGMTALRTIRRLPMRFNHGTSTPARSEQRPQIRWQG